MKFTLLFSLFVYLGSYASTEQVYSSIAELSFFKELEATPEFKKCLDKFKKDQVQQISDCIIKKVSYKDNENQLEKVFKNDPNIKTQPTNLKKERYVQKKLKEKLMSELIGKNLSPEELEKAFNSSNISTIDLQRVYKRQLEKNQLMHISNFCLFQVKKKSNQSYDEKVIDAFKTLESKGYDVAGSISKCLKKVKTANCLGKESDVCLLNTKLKSYANAIDKLEANLSDLNDYYKNNTAPFKSFLNGDIIEVDDNILNNSTSISSQEVKNIYTKSDDMFFEDHSSLIQKHCINKFDKKRCEQLVDHKESDNYNKLKLKLELQYKNRDERIKLMTHEELKDYIEKSGIFTRKELDNFQNKNAKDLQQTITTIFRNRKEAILKSLKQKIAKRSENIKNKNYQEIKDNVAKKADVMESLVMFNNILNGLVMQDSSDLEREIENIDSNNSSRETWLKNLSPNNSNSNSNTLLKDLFSF